MVVGTSATDINAHLVSPSVSPTSGGLDAEAIGPPPTPEEISDVSPEEMRSLRYLISVYGGFKGSARSLLFASMLRTDFSP